MHRIRTILKAFLEILSAAIFSLRVQARLWFGCWIAGQNDRENMYVDVSYMFIFTVSELQ